METDKNWERIKHQRCREREAESYARVYDANCWPGSHKIEHKRGEGKKYIYMKRIKVNIYET